MRSELNKQHRVVASYHVSGKPMGSIFKDQAVKEEDDSLTLEDGTDRSSYSYHSTLRKTPKELRSHLVLG